MDLGNDVLLVAYAVRELLAPLEQSDRKRVLELATNRRAEEPTAGDSLENGHVSGYQTLNDRIRRCLSNGMHGGGTAREIIGYLNQDGGGHVNATSVHSRIHHMVAAGSLETFGSTYPNRYRLRAA